MIEAKPIFPTSLYCNFRRVKEWRDKEQNEAKNNSAELRSHLVCSLF